MAKDHNHDCNHDHSLDELDEETQRKIQQLQVLEQNFQQLLMQKQAFRYELDETEFAIEEIKKSEGETFRIISGQIMIKSTKEKINEELNHKKQLIEMRMKSIDKQEQEFSKQIESIRTELLKKISGNKN